MAFREPATTCEIHGSSPTGWCAACDTDQGVQRHPVTGHQSTAEERQKDMVDALRAAGLSDAQVQTVLSTLSGTTARPVTDEQLMRVLGPLKAQLATNEAIQQGVMPVATDQPFTVPTGSPPTPGAA